MPLLGRAAAGATFVLKWPFQGSERCRALCCAGDRAGLEHWHCCHCVTSQAQPGEGLGKAPQRDHRMFALKGPQRPRQGHLPEPSLLSVPLVLFLMPREEFPPSLAAVPAQEELLGVPTGALRPCSGVTVHHSSANGPGSLPGTGIIALPCSNSISNTSIGIFLWFFSYPGSTKISA